MANPAEKVTWTVCPQSVTHSGDLQVSVFVAPRLTHDAGTVRLETWADTWKDWPSALANIELALTVFPGADPSYKTLSPANNWQVSLNANVYAALFDPHNTAVIAHTFTDLSHKTFVSYPVAKMAAMIEEMYIAFGFSANDDTLPSPTDLLNPKNPVPGAQNPVLPGFPRYDGRKPAQEVLKSIQGQGLTAMTTGAKSLGELTDLFSFYHQPMLAAETHSHIKKRGDDPNGRESAKWPGYKRPARPDAKKAADAIDFHRIAAAVSNYAELSRLCGLVIDLTIPAAKIAFLPPGPCALALQVKRKGISGTDVTPRTLCTYTGTGIQATPKTPAAYAGRFLNMETNGLEFIQMDVDGAAHKAIALGSSLGRMKATANYDDDFLKDNDPGPLPEVGAASLRSAGIMVAKSRRHEEVMTKTARSAELNKHIDEATPKVPDLYAEDLQRGFRVDVQDVKAGPRWQSLNRRLVDYNFLKSAPLDDKTIGQFKWTVNKDHTVTGTSPEEEGLISLALGSSADGTSPDVYTLHEGLFVWRGWSLSAAEPANSLRTVPVKPTDDSEQARHTAMVGPTKGEAVDGLPLQADFRAAPKSLPALRFGHGYRLRLRSVDLTGGSASWQDDGPVGSVSRGVVYRRYEPLESPVLTLISKAEFKKPDLGQPLILGDDHIVSRPMQGESMGRLALRSYFNDPDAKPLKPSVEGKVQRNVAAARVTQRFAETHGPLDAGGRIKGDSDTYNALVRLDQSFDTVELAAAEDPHGETTRYAIAGGKFDLPYLPDPYAFGVMVRFRALDDKTWNDLYVPLYGDKYDPTWSIYGDTAHPEKIPPWPSTRPLRIVGSDDPSTKFDFVGGAITIPMPKACRQRVRLSSLMANAAIDNMALWALIAETAQRNKMSAERIHDLIKAGQHWMFTPWREIELVHATQRPLVRPILHEFDQTRTELGQLDTIINMQTPLNSPSTVRLDLLARWQEPEDNAVEIAAKSAPFNVPHQQVVIQQPIARRDCMAGQYPMHDVSHVFPDTRYRRVFYSMDALSRFPEFFESIISEDEAKQKVTTTKEERRFILNSSPPPAPHIAYVIPTFGWFRNGGAMPGSKRTGGLRVYLERPWLATGYNEMLAVLLPNSGDATIPDDPDASGDAAANHPYVTQWGRDPIRLSADITSNSPKRTAFRLARFQGPIKSPNSGLPEDEGTDVPTGPFKVTGFLVPGQPGTRRYAVAPHEVGYDASRQMWYADVAVNIPNGSYFPFLRLTVARYQPFSLDGAHLSSAATCDFMQISPDRIAVVVPLDPKLNRYQVFLYGDEPQDSQVNNEARRGSIVIQPQVLDAGADPVLGWRDDPVVAQSGPPMPGLPGDPSIASQAAGRATDLAKTVIGDDHRVSTTSPQAMAAGSITANAGIAASQLSLAPNLITAQVFTAGPAPAGGKRRLLIVENEKMLSRVRSIEGPGDIERVVYAEGIEF